MSKLWLIDELKMRVNKFGSYWNVKILEYGSFVLMFQNGDLGISQNKFVYIIAKEVAH